MTSLAFSVGNCSSTKLSTPTARLLITSLDKSDVSTIKFPSQNCSSQRLQLNENETLLKRREAIGFGLCFGLIDVFWKPQPISAAEGTPPCELIVAPSGLAFCDKVVGYGPEPVKGQLIKVNIRETLFSFFLRKRNSRKVKWLYLEPCMHYVNTVYNFICIVCLGILSVL